MRKRRGILAMLMVVLAVTVLLSGCRLPELPDSGTLDLGAISQQPEKTDEQLMTIEVFSENNKLDRQNDFYYDEQGRLSDVYCHYFGAFGEESYVYHKKIQYDEQGRLIFATSGDTYGYAPGKNSGQMYTYNEQGQLIESRDWEGGVVITEYTYDSSGKCTYSKETAEGMVVETEYQYDSLAEPVKAVKTKTYYDDSQSRETITYSYDKQGRLIREVSIDDEDNTVTLSYDYSYAPFVLCKSECYDYPGSNFSKLILQTDSRQPLYEIYFSEATNIEEADGYIKMLQAYDEKYCFHFGTDRLQIELTEETAP